MRALLVTATLLLAAAPVAAQPALAPEAQTHLDAGLALFDHGDYDAAMVELQIAYRIDPQPPLLFAIAQAKRLAGRCDEALPLYYKYIETQPKENQELAAQTGVQLCNDEVAARARDQAFVPPAPREEAEPTAPAARPGGAWRKAAVVTGAIAVVAVGVWGYSYVQIKDAEEALSRTDTYDEETIDRLNRRGDRYSTVSFIAGPTTLVAAGVCAFAIYKGFIAPPSARENRSRVVVTPTIAPDGAGAAVQIHW